MKRTPRLLSLVAVAATAFGVATAVVPSAALADTTPPAGSVSTVTQDALPTVQINGIVWSQTTVGNTVYVVGNFSSARPAGSPAGTNETPRANILAYDIRTGELDTTFVHALNGQGKVVTASPDGSTVYVGGTFTTVDGVARSRVAAFSTATGQLTSYAPTPNSTVYGLTATNDAVYFGGVFSAVGGVARTRVAATTTSGALLPWAPSVDNIVRTLVTVPSTSRVVFGGHFRNVNGATNYGLAAVDTSTGANVNFPATTQIIAADGSTGSGILSLKTDGVLVYGTGFNSVSASFPQFEGTFAVDPSTGNLSWVNDCWGDTYDVTPIAGALYTASHAHDCAAAGAFPELKGHYFGLAWNTVASTGYNVRDGRGWNYSAFHTSKLLQWNPAFTNGKIANQSVWSFAGNADYVSAGGEFPTVNGTAQQGLVRFAVHAKAPNAYAPMGMDTPTATVNGSRVDVTVTTAYDPDDDYVTYALVRDGDSSNPVATTTVPTVGFWQQANRPKVTLSDTTAAAGSTHTYQIRASDAGGASTLSVSASATTQPTPPPAAANLALQRPASQSSTSGQYVASRAVDGNTSGVLTSGSVSSTTNARRNWWQVDLQSSQRVSRVVVWNRTDASSSRLSDYWVFTSNSPFNTSLTPTQLASQAGVWSSHQRSAPNPSTSVALPAGSTGRYVMIAQGTSYQFLTLAEVQVFG